MIEFDTTDFDEYTNDRDLEVETGIWLKFPGGRRLRVLRAGGSNKAFGRARDKYVQSKMGNKKKLPTGVISEAIREAIIETVVVDWDGFKTRTGEPIPFTKSAVRALFEQFPDFYDDVQDIVLDRANFQEQEAEEVSEHMGES